MLSPRVTMLVAAASVGCGTPAPVECECEPPLRFDADASRCVECLTDDECEGGRCDPERYRCVRCLDDSDCSALRPVCAAGTCVGCRSNEDCDSAERSVCSPRRDCERCAEDADCAHIDSRSACAAGRCVECSAANETACGAGVCDVRAGVCTARPARSGVACTECVSDRECVEGQLCVAVEGDGVARCAWRADAPPRGPAGSCFGARPHTALVEATSVGGVTAGVCRPSVGCEQLGRFGTTPCDEARGRELPARSPTCGQLCAPSGGDEGRCTTYCESLVHCPCADEACTRHYACVQHHDATLPDTFRACDLERTCALSDPACHPPLTW